MLCLVAKTIWFHKTVTVLSSFITLKIKIIIQLLLIFAQHYYTYNVTSFYILERLLVSPLGPIRVSPLRIVTIKVSPSGHTN